ncbi:MAG: hypothetical protein D8B56_00775 [Alloprevotella sp.]|nr:MAG: hypothetical protein D8B56_00775 [Alloprevotella sp.]
MIHFVVVLSCCIDEKKCFQHLLLTFWSKMLSDCKGSKKEFSIREETGKIFPKQQKVSLGSTFLFPLLLSRSMPASVNI